MPFFSENHIKCLIQTVRGTLRERSMVSGECRTGGSLLILPSHKAGHDSSDWWTFSGGGRAPNTMVNSRRSREVMKNMLLTARPPWSQGFWENSSFQRILWSVLLVDLTAVNIPES